MNNDKTQNESNSGWDEIPVPISADVAWQNMNALLDNQQTQKKRKFFWLFLSLTSIAIGMIGYYFLSKPKSNVMMVAQTEPMFKESSRSEYSIEQKENDNVSENIIELAEENASEQLKDVEIENDKKDKINEEEERVESTRAKKIHKNDPIANTRKSTSAKKENEVATNVVLANSTTFSKSKKESANKLLKNNTPLLTSNNTIQKTKENITADVNNNLVAQKQESYLIEEPRVFNYLQLSPIKEFAADSVDAPTPTNIKDKRSAKDYNPYVMGINVGMGLNKTLWNKSTSYLQPAFINLFVDYYFMPKYAVGFEVTPFHSRGSKYSYTYNYSSASDNVDTKITNTKNYTYKVNTLNYSDVSCYLKHSLNNHLILGFGLYGSYLQTANMNISLSDSVITYNKQTKGSEYSASLIEDRGNLKQLEFSHANTLLKKYDIGTVLSAYYVLNNWQLGITYQRGLTNYSANQHASKFYTQYIKATVGFRF